jgi:uncharacterized membrane protein YccC
MFMLFTLANVGIGVAVALAGALFVFLLWFEDYSKAENGRRYIREQEMLEDAFDNYQTIQLASYLGISPEALREEENSA